MAGQRQRLTVQTERFWLAAGVSFLVGGGGMMIAAKTPVHVYLGVAMWLIAVYIALGVFVSRVPLPKLPSERLAESFQNGLDSLLADGVPLYRQPIASDEELAAWQAQVEAWSRRTRDWLSQNVSESRAAEFAYPTPRAAQISGSYSEAHNRWRLGLGWRLSYLRKLEEHGP